MANLFSHKNSGKDLLQQSDSVKEGMIGLTQPHKTQVKPVESFFFLHFLDFAVILFILYGTFSEPPKNPATEDLVMLLFLCFTLASFIWIMPRLYMYFIRQFRFPLLKSLYHSFYDDFTIDFLGQTKPVHAFYLRKIELKNFRLHIVHCCLSSGSGKFVDVYINKQPLPVDIETYRSIILDEGLGENVLTPKIVGEGFYSGYPFLDVKYTNKDPEAEYGMLRVVVLGDRFYNLNYVSKTPITDWDSFAGSFVVGKRAQAAQKPHWFKYRAKGNFEVMFPTRRNEHKVNYFENVHMQPVEEHMLYGSVGQDFYRIEWTNLYPDKEGVLIDIDAYVKDITSEYKKKDVTIKKFTFQGEPCTQWIVPSHIEGKWDISRVILKGSFCYRLLCIVENKDNKDAKRFMDSLKINNAKAAAKYPALIYTPKDRETL